MKAKPNTIVGNLAICSNCGNGLEYKEEFGIWVHFEGANRQLSPN
jgi:hypothetical protein